MPQSIAFHGAAQTVTGSRHLLNLNGKNVLVDCGMFQGGRELRQRNWELFPIPPHEIDAIVITHAHMDHIGYLPKLSALGYQGPIYATRATIKLSRISLPDSARIQEEDARTANKVGSRHQPALPLYTEDDAYAVLKLFKPLHYHQTQALPGGAQFRFLPAGHILGSAFAEIYFDNGERILMGGDLGRYNTPIIKDPEQVDFAEYLVVESTYGDRLHKIEDPKEKLASIFADAWQGGNRILVPSFSIGRTQELLYYISRLQAENKMPRIPVFIDSPMATSATEAYRSETEEHDRDMKLSLDQGISDLDPEGVFYIRDRKQSQELNFRQGPFMVIAGSGMANGGRIVHHLLHHISDESTIVLFTGYQAEGTLGRRILEGQEVVRILKREVPVRARIEKLNALSAHADQGEILTWLKGFKAPPRKTFIVHGEPHAQEALQTKIHEELGWDVVIPRWHEQFDL
ncbi:MAG: MBL fold metallo-hydrolase RNA specificity domain-containing protein [Fimbriimonas sp.]